jgi:hypothetical protein
VSRFGVFRTRHSRPLLWAVPLLCGMACAGGDHGNPPPLRSAFLGVQVTPEGGSGIDPSLVASYQEVIQGGFPAVQFEFDWGTVERYLGVQDWTSIEIQAIQARRTGVSVSCEVLLIDNQAGPQVPGRLPLDLEGRLYDDGGVRVRLVYFVRELARRLRPQLAYIWLGRDVDVYFRENPNELPSFLDLVRLCQDSLAVDVPEVRIGTIINYGEARQGGRLPLCRTIAGGVEWLGLNVYGRDRNYRQVLGPDSTVQLLGEAVRYFAPKPVILCELGYPGDESGRSGQEAFAAGLTRFLANPPPNLNGAFWYCLHDWRAPDALALARLKYFGEPDREQGYAAQLVCLGARSLNGVAKPAWSVLAQWNRARAEVAVAQGKRIVR